MKMSFPFENLNHIPAIYRRELPEKNIQDWFYQSLELKIRERENFNGREILVSVLKNQYNGILTSKVEENIEKLSQKNTFTVTTGHQLNLFGGPLFFIYKIFSTINLAEDLKKKFPEKNFVPVFWMASEDHDFEEIQSTHLYGKTLKWETNREGAVGRFQVKDMDSVLNELESLKGTMSYADELINILRRAYSEGKTLSQASRTFINDLFSEYGLVIIDADDSELKKSLVPVIEKEILEQPIKSIVDKKNEELIAEGFNPQVHPREINFFHLGNEYRKRIIQEDENTFSVIDTDKKWSREELKKEIQSSPENFSPNVLIRPLYQEIILPNIAYIGGPGEISYWKQLDEVFAHFSVLYPVLMHRHNALLIDPNTANKIQKLNLNEEDLFSNTDDIIRKYIESVASEEIHLDEYKNEIRELFTRLSHKAENVDPTLKPGVMAELQKQIHYLENLEGRLRKAEKQKHETSVNQIRHIRDKLFPEGHPQERYESFIPFYFKYGKEGMEELRMNFDSFDLRYRFVYLD